MKNGSPLLFAVNSSQTFEWIESATGNARILNPFRILLGLDKLFDYLHHELLAKKASGLTSPLLLLIEDQFGGRPAWEVLNWLRSIEAFRKLPVLVLLGAAEVDRVNRLYDAGANSCVLKPTALEHWTDFLEQVRAYWIELNTQPEWE